MRTPLIIFVYLLCVFAVKPALAEYRVFVLKIEDTAAGQAAGAARTVTTTLDDRQYAEYYPVHPGEKVSIQETWMCRYYRSDVAQDATQSYCPNPRGPASVPLNHGGFGGSYDSSAAPAGGLGKATFTDPKPQAKTSAKP